MKTIMIFLALFMSMTVNASVLPIIVGENSNVNLSAGISHKYQDNYDPMILSEIPIFKKFVLPGTARAAYIYNHLEFGYNTQVHLFNGVYMGTYSSVAFSISDLNNVELNVYPYLFYAFPAKNLFFNVWTGIELLQAVNGYLQTVVGARAFYKPLFPLYLQAEFSRKFMSLSLGLYL